MSKLAHQLLPPELLQVLPVDRPIWLVGGALRDHFLQRDQPDRDFAVEGQAIQTARSIADQLGGSYFTLDVERDAGRVVLDRQLTLDFVGLRGLDIESDLQARDFTVNALATPVHGGPELIDPLGGLQDLRDRVLKTCGPNALQDDPIRALRGVRLAHEHRLRIVPETAARIRQAAPLLRSATAERVRDELAAMLRPANAAGLRLAHELGCLEPVLPEAAGEPTTAQAGLNIAGRLAAVLGAFNAEDRAENFTNAQVALALGRYREQLDQQLSQQLAGGNTRAQMAMLAALHWPIKGGAAAVRRRARALRFSRKEAQRAETIVAHADPDRLLEIGTPLGRHRYHREAGEAGVEAVLLSLAVSLAASSGPPGHSQWERLTMNARELLALGLGEIIEPPPLIDGEQLMVALGLISGPEVGRLLEKVREAQIEGQIGTAEQALALARRLQGEQ